MKARMLRVNLDNREIGTQEVDEATLRSYIGGSGLGAKVLWEETTATTQALSPANPLVFAVGPLTGLAPQTGRYSVSAISPATEAWGEAHSGGLWGKELRWTGWWGIIIRGRAPRPVYLYVNNDRAEIRDASHLWGKDTFETSDLLRKETEEHASVACIGMAGERGVRVAGIVNDGWDGRFAARGGLGAVMGSKNLKAIVLRGTRKPQVADQSALKESTQPVIQYLTQIRLSMGPERLRSLGRGRREAQNTGNLPVRNWSRGRFESFVEKIGASLVHTKLYFCYSCPVGCAESTIGPKGREIVGEALMPLGSNCLIDDLEAIEEAYRLCNRYGMDTISVGACVAFGMEAFEKGLITREDTEGVELAWGSGQALVDMVKQMGEARSFGKVLGQGVKRAAAQIGGDADQFAMHVKGLEVPLHDPRAYPSLLLSYATANRGGCHLESHSYAIDRKGLKMGKVLAQVNAQELGWPPEKVERLSFEGKADIAAKTQDLEAMNNALCICNFSYFTYGVQAHNYLSWLNAVTGWDMTWEDYMKTGERIFNLKRLFNLRRGLSGKDDTIPQRFLTRRPEVGDAEIVAPSFPDLLQEYYALRGWTREGVPTPEKLAELGLPTA